MTFGCWTKDPFSTSDSNSSAADGRATDDAVKGSSEKDVPSVDGSGDPLVGSMSQQEGGIDFMFDRLDLGEEDFDDLVIEESDVNLAESTRWLAVAKVNCTKRFSHEAFFQKMRNAWNSARDISIRAVADNRFVIQCFCLEDWEKVTLRDPWLFREWAVLISPYDGLSDPESIDLQRMPIWIHVLNSLRPTGGNKL
jgi:hypothetical protein